MPLSPSASLNLAAAALLALVATAVVLRHGRARPALALGAFAGGLAGFWAFEALGAPNEYILPLWVGIVSYLFIGIGMLAIVFTSPMPLRRDEWGLVGVALGAAILVAALYALTAPNYFDVARDQRGPGVLALRLANSFASAGALTALLVFPLRVARLPPDRTTAARSLALLSVGLLLFIMGTSNAVVTVAMGTAPSSHLINPIAEVAVVALWVWATRGAHARLARNTALAGVCIIIAALILATQEATIVYPAGRLVGALLLGFALMRGLIEGLDLKVRFAISKSTIAAVFIAVFFIASEAAQQFFGDTLGSTYVGIAAAGALVFAIAPLQRAAERLAEKAVPLHEAPAVTTRDAQRREAVFMKAARLAMRGGLSRDEEVDLAELAEELGIGAGRAASLLREAERARAEVA